MKSIDAYQNQEEDASTSVNTVDIRSINWREDLRKKAIGRVIEDDGEAKKRAEAKDDFDIEPQELKIRSSQVALSIVNNLNSFCKTLGDADLANAFNLVTRRLETLRPKNVSQKK